MSQLSRIFRQSFRENSVYSMLFPFGFRFLPEIQNLQLLHNHQVTVGMATCHSLSIINGNLSGDPLELIMFEAVGWVRTLHFKISSLNVEHIETRLKYKYCTKTQLRD